MTHMQVGEDNRTVNGQFLDLRPFFKEFEASHFHHFYSLDLIQGILRNFEELEILNDSNQAQEVNKQISNHMEQVLKNT